MKANEFVETFGWGEAKLNASSCSHQYYFTYSGHDICVADLKRLVESHELVEKYKNRHGGIRFRIRWGQFRHGDTQEYNNRLKQAILDVEGCQ